MYFIQTKAANKEILKPLGMKRVVTGESHTNVTSQLFCLVVVSIFTWQDVV